MRVSSRPGLLRSKGVSASLRLGSRMVENSEVGSQVSEWLEGPGPDNGMSER